MFSPYGKLWDPLGSFVGIEPRSTGSKAWQADLDDFSQRLRRGWPPYPLPVGPPHQSTKHSQTTQSASVRFENYPLVMTNIAMENGPFIDGLPIKNGDFPWLC